MSASISSIKSKIAKLVNLSADNANLQEATAALKMAHALMAEWGLCLTDIELEKEDIVYREISTHQKKACANMGVVVRLATFFDVKIWQSRINRVVHLNLMGYTPDIEMFVKMYEIIIHVREMEFNKYKQTAEYKKNNQTHHGTSIRAAWNKGFNITINTRLNNLIKEKKFMQTGSGTALVPLKMKKIEGSFADRFSFRLSSRSSARSRGHDVTLGNTIDSGQTSAQKVVIAGNNSSSRMIG